MGVEYGMTIENLILIQEKAELKNNGVYSFRGVKYRVAQGVATHLAYQGKIYQVFGAFVSCVGNYEYHGGIDSSEAKKALIAI